MEKTLQDIVPNFSSYLDSKKVKIYFAKRRDSSLYGKKILLEGDEMNSGVKVKGKEDFFLMQRDDVGRFLRKYGDVTIYNSPSVSSIEYLGIVPGFSNHSGDQKVLLHYYSDEKSDPHRTDGNSFVPFP